MLPCFQLMNFVIERNFSLAFDDGPVFTTVLVGLVAETLTGVHDDALALGVWEIHEDFEASPWAFFESVIGEDVRASLANFCHSFLQVLAVAFLAKD